MSTLTDFISPQVLEREGYIHISDNEKMLEYIDKAFLAAHGWFHKPNLGHVNLSVNKASDVVGVAPQTLAGYIRAGYMPANDDGQVRLVDAMTFDYKAAKRALLDSKNRTNNSH